MFYPSIKVASKLSYSFASETYQTPFAASFVTVISFRNVHILDVLIKALREQLPAEIMLSQLIYIYIYIYPTVL